MTELFSRRVELVQSFLDSMAGLDFDHLGDHLAEDAVMVLPFLEALPPIHGKTAIVDQTKATMEQMFDWMRFSYDAWYDVHDSDTLIAEYHSEAGLKDGRGTYRNQYITVFRFDSEKITLYKEFLNPGNVMAVAPQADTEAAKP
jgi:ketosteroid isomerase-like protein